MIGPSSSHTAGALKIGLELHKKIKGKIRRIEITLYNSFADTGNGHGTKVALLAGLLGFSSEDQKLKESIRIVYKKGIKVIFKTSHDKTKHPNSSLLVVKTSSGKFAGFGESIGGGLTNFEQICMEPVK